MMRISTWNLKQALFAQATPEALWAWADERIQADVLVFTEAKPPKDHVAAGWTALWNPEGLYPKNRNRWGTIIASRTCDLVPVTEVKRRFRWTPLEFHWPAAVQVADIYSGGNYWATIVGLYAPVRKLDGSKTENAAISFDRLFEQLLPLLNSERGKRLLVAGDFNLFPTDVHDLIQPYGLTDLIEYTAPMRAPLQGCANCTFLAKIGRASIDPCGHLWTHRNEGGPNPKKQQIDFIFGTDALVSELESVSGGVADFPDVWDISDHAPVVADFAM